MKKNNSQASSLVIKGENVIGTINASGRAQLKVEQSVIHQAAPEMDRLFKHVHERLETQAAQASPDSEKIQEQVKKIEKEAAKGEKSDLDKLESWLVKLAEMAPDILDVMLAALGGPLTGFTAVFKKIADRARAMSRG